MHTTILDTHLHLYPEYDLTRAFNTLLDNTSQYGEEVKRIACLAERHDCQYFQQLSSNLIQLDDFTFSSDAEHELTLKRNRDGLKITLLPGRQVITKENIEILALACPEMIDDQQPAIDVIYQINQFGRIPVIAWSPGKWFAKRGELVKKLISQLEHQDFLIGDTTLRPYGWCTPKLMKAARNLGYTVVAGSDPLPFTGEEDWLGSYHSVVKSGSEYGATELLHELKQGNDDIKCTNRGKRTHIFNLFQRLQKNAASKKAK